MSNISSSKVFKHINGNKSGKREINFNSEYFFWSFCFKKSAERFAQHQVKDMFGLTILKSKEVFCQNFMDISSFLGRLVLRTRQP